VCKQHPLFAGDTHHRLLQLFKGAHLYLADTFAADIIMLAQLFQCLGLIDQATLGQDVLFAVIQPVQRLGEHRVAHVSLLCIGDALVLQRFIIDQPVLPLSLAIFAHRHIKRGVSTHCHAAVHFDDFGLGHAQIG
jgi:hypothetical protein